MPTAKQVCVSALAIGFIGTAIYLFYKRRTPNENDENGRNGQNNQTTIEGPKIEDGSYEGTAGPSKVQKEDGISVSTMNVTDIKF